MKAARLVGRLDAKYLNPWSVGKLEPAWEKAGAQTATLGDMVDHIEEQVSIHPAKTYTFLRISYAGYASGGEKRLGSEISYDWIGRAEPEDIVISNINAVNGATCVLPEKAKGHLITSEYTVLRVKKETDVDPMYLRPSLSGRNCRVVVILHRVRPASCDVGFVERPEGAVVAQGQAGPNRRAQSKGISPFRRDDGDARKCNRQACSSGPLW